MSYYANYSVDINIFLYLNNLDTIKPRDTILIVKRVNEVNE